MATTKKPEICVCCGRSVPLTFHHLIPRKLHRRAHFKKHFCKATLNEGVYVCRQCHRGIHKTYDEMTLAKEFCTLDGILSDDALRNHFDWVSKQREQS